MQAMMQRMMNDPAYQERFDKMSKQEQEAEMRKYMGNEHAPAPPTGETAAERRAKRATDETAAVIARQKELADIKQRIYGIDAVFAKKDQAILATPGGHDQIAKEISARVEKLPVVAMAKPGTWSIRSNCRRYSGSKLRANAPAPRGNFSNAPRSTPSAKPGTKRRPLPTRRGSSRTWERSLAKTPRCWTTRRSKWQ